MASMTFGQKTFNAKPPQKGSFPLDHDAECKLFMLHYISCLNKHDMDNGKCRLASKEYLECRMTHNLMKREDWSKLGYGTNQHTE